MNAENFVIRDVFASCRSSTILAMWARSVFKWLITACVSAGAWLEIDLLRQRRERYGTQRPAVINVRTPLLRGSLLVALHCSCCWVASGCTAESRLSQRAQNSR